MARAAPQRQAPVQMAPPPQEAEAPLFDYILAFVQALDPSFPPQGTDQTDNDYLRGICEFLSPQAGYVTDETWNQFAIDAQAWYTAAIDAIGNEQEIPAPDGFYQDPEPEPEPAPAKRPVPAGIAAYQAKQAAEKAAKAAAPAPTTNGAAPPRRGPAPPPVAAAPAVPPRRGPAPAAPAPAPAPQRRAPPAAAPAAPAVPPRRGPAPAAPAPAVPVRRGPAPAAAPAPAARTRVQAIGRDDEIVRDLRTQVIYDPEMTPSQLVAYAREKQYPQADSSIMAMCSQVKSIMALAYDLGLQWPEQP